jgi:hypothetical protein
VVAQPITTPVVGPDATVAENAIAIWAVFDVLDTVPATPDTQQAFETARARVQRQIEAAGIDTNAIDLAFAGVELPRFEARGDPPVC